MFKALERGYFTKREMEALGEPVGMPDRGPAFGERNDPVTAVTAAAQIGSSLISADAAGDAADQQNAALDKDRQLKYDIWQQTRQDNMPALETRNWALEQLKAQLSKGFAPQNVQREAGYQFGMDQGMNALKNQLAARGMRNSGAALKSGVRFAEDYAGTKYDNAFSRSLRSLDPFLSLAGASQVGASTVAGAGDRYATGVGDNVIQSGNVNALSGIAKANQYGNALSSVGGWFDDYMKRQQAPYDYNFRGTELPGVLRGGQ